MTAQAAAPPAIETRGLSKRFGDRVAVAQLDLRVDRGSIFGFLGPNGSGKSTTIKMLCGLLSPSAGAAQVDGFDVVRDAERVRAAIGYMSQSFALYGDLTVDQNLEFYGRAYGLEPARRARRKAEVSELTGVGAYSQQQAATLSGGWKQRLALASALLHEPRVVFLDEPTAGIDPVARRDLWDLLFRLAGEGVTLFVTTHYMDEAERCTKVAYIDAGSLIAQGTLEELRALRGVTPPGTERYVVRAEAVMAAFARARALPYVRDATIFGRDLHVVIEAGVGADRLSADIAERAGPVSAVEPIEPSLEDVFVMLTRARGAA